MQKKQSMKKGFTIIETLLAMSGVALMMIAIAVLTINISRIYSKGITIKNVNESARSILDDLNRSISASPALVGNDGIDSFPVNQRRFCTGMVSYIWNEWQPNGGWATPTNNWNGQPVRFVKVRDTNRKYCTPIPNSNGQFPTIDDSDDPEELLGESEENLVLYGFVIFNNNDGMNINRRNGQVFYSGSFVLGTRSEGVGNTSGDITADGLVCRPPGDAEQTGLEYYCSINKFNFAQRAMGSSL
jgi:type II secretory pathway pseudopilin PulG